MHRLWSYDGANAIQHWTAQVSALCAKIQGERDPQLRQEWRLRVQGLSEDLSREQSRLHHILCELERDWDLYMDRESRDEYYEGLTALYLKCGGHWATLQEEGEMHCLTHQASIIEIDGKLYEQDKPLWQRPEAYKRGRNQLFKTSTPAQAQTGG